MGSKGHQYAVRVDRLEALEAALDAVPHVLVEAPLLGAEPGTLEEG
jgi:hypothetical protein